jgi:hypothetical protein
MVRRFLRGKIWNVLDRDFYEEQRGGSHRFLRSFYACGAGVSGDSLHHSKRKASGSSPLRPNNPQASTRKASEP